METSRRKQDDDTCDGSQTTEAHVFESRDDYFAALQKWLHDAHAWQNSMAYMPYFFLSHPELFGVPPLPTPNYLTDASRRAVGPLPTYAWPASAQRGAASRMPTQPPGGLQYKIPPYWKRFCAEVVDSVIMTVLKLFTVFMAVYVFKFIDLDKYSLQMLQQFQQNVQSVPYKVAVEMTSQLLVLELMNRIVVCLLEAYWLRGGEGGRIGGSTPGKNLFGLRVVLCYQAQPIAGQPNEFVLVTPGTDLGWGWALTRALSKNIFFALIYPLCFAFFFFKFNRLGYDVLSHSIVIENVDQNNNRR